MNERQVDEPFDDRLEWDQDGQYYHYIIKWMHALNRVGNVTGDANYVRWAVELAQVAHKSFTYLPANRERKIMYWKMSIDLSHPLVPSMGQHDPLDGFVTYNELQVTAKNEFNQSNIPDLSNEISEMVDICRGMNWVTNDPLGIGGLLFDAARITQLNIKGETDFNALLEVVLNSALLGISSFFKSNPLGVPVNYRLAFRELGLSIGLKGIDIMQKWFNDHPDSFNRNSSINELIDSFKTYLSLGDAIDKFWMQSKNWQFGSWAEHREINMVMLATSLAPDEFIRI